MYIFFIKDKRLAELTKATDRGHSILSVASIYYNFLSL